MINRRVLKLVNTGRHFCKRESYVNVSPRAKFPDRVAQQLLLAVVASFSEAILKISRGKGRENRRQKLSETVEENGTRRIVVFPVEEAHIGPDARARNGRLKEVLLRDKPEVIWLSRGETFFPFCGLSRRITGPPTNIHSRLTLLFTVCGYLFSFLSRLSEFSSVALFAIAPFFHRLPRTGRDNRQ